MGHHSVQVGFLDFPGHFFGAEALLSCSAPDIDTIRLHHQQPIGMTGQFPAQYVKGQLKVAGDQHRALRIRLAQGVEARRDPIMVPAKAQANHSGP
jgi:hypothetical protein